MLLLTAEISIKVTPIMIHRTKKTSWWNVCWAFIKHAIKMIMSVLVTLREWRPNSDVTVQCAHICVSYLHIWVVVYGHSIRKNLHILNQQKLQCGRDRCQRVILSTAETQVQTLTDIYLTLNWYIKIFKLKVRKRGKIIKTENHVTLKSCVAVHIYISYVETQFVFTLQVIKAFRKAKY